MSGSRAFRRPIPGGPRAAVPIPFLAAILALPCAAASQEAAPVGDGPLPIDPQVTVGTLDNGLRYYIRANERPEHRAELRLVVNAGSVLEDEDQRGLAHFLEHMAFNGTRHFEKQELVDYLESIGTRFGPDLNAYTGFDETVYMLTVPTDTAGLLETGLQVLEDWAWGQSLDPAEIEKERGVVLEEWRLGRGAGARMRDQQLPVLLHGSRYAERLPIGRPEVIEGFERATLERFYRDWYRPELMAVVAVGDFDPARVEAMIRERFGRIPAAVDPRERPAYDVPGHPETLFAIATDPEATGSSVAVYHKLPPAPRGTAEAYRQRLVERLFNGMLNGRLQELAQGADPPFLGAGSNKGRFVGPGEAYMLTAGVEDGGVVEGLEALLTEAARVARHGFTASELERQKTRMLRAVERAYAERDKTESRRLVGEYVGHFLDDEPIPGIAYEYELHQQYLPGITLEEVNRLAGQWIGARDRVVLAGAPEKDGVPVPTEAELRAVLESTAGARVAAYTDSVVDEPLVPDLPEGAAIASESTIPELDVTEWRLANGVRVIVKPTDFKDDEILMNAFSPGGLGLVADSAYVSGMLAPNVVQRGGVGPFGMIDLQKRLAGKSVGVRPFIGATEEGLSGYVSPRDLETLLQLTYLYFTAPRADTVAYRALTNQLASMVANRSASPEQVFYDTVQTTMTRQHFRARPMTAEVVRELDLGTALDVYRERFADAGDFTFLFVGTIDPDTLRPLVRRYLGALPATGRVDPREPLDLDPPPDVVEKTVRKGTEPKASADIRFEAPYAYSERNAMAVDAMAGVLRIRLRDVLREDLGGTYGVQVGAGIQREPEEECSARIAFGADPARVDSLAGVVFEQIRALRAEGPTTEEVGKVREMRRRGLEENREENGYWVGALSSRYRHDEDPRRILDQESMIAGIEAAAIREAARACLTPDAYARFYLLPESPEGR